MATDTITGPAILGSTTRTRVFKNFIDGEWVESQGGQTFEDRNPADNREVVAIFQRSNKADVDAAVDAAKRAFAKWRLVPAPRRAEMVFRAAEILIERKEDYARDMTREMGKVLKETRGDVQEAIDAAYYNAGEGRHVRSDGTSRIAQQIRYVVRQPIASAEGSLPGIFPWQFLLKLLRHSLAVTPRAEASPGPPRPSTSSRL
jgi:aldehyde dehydrogenase (NAD+)